MGQRVSPMGLGCLMLGCLHRRETCAVGTAERTEPNTSCCQHTEHRNKPVSPHAGAHERVAVDPLSVAAPLQVRGPVLGAAHAE